MFVVLSFVYGLALFCLVLIPAYAWTGRELGDVIVNRLRKLLGIFIAAALYFVIVFNLTNFYSAAKADGIQNFLLFGDNSYSQTFWIGQILIGSLVPLGLTLLPGFKSRGSLVIASILVVIGGLSQMYVTIIGGQAYPMDMFPGKEVSSVIGDGAIAEYSASIYEFLLGIAGIAITLFIAVFAMKALRILPTSLADKEIDPHHSA
jgi:molybdopterin-containing oxidoreductase family membrane subunit